MSPEDSNILAILRRGLEVTDSAPSDVSEFAKAVFRWRDIDAELAQLDFDSVDEEAPTGVRSSITARMLSFQAGRWVLDVEYDESSRRLIGQIEPATAFRVDLHSAGTFFSVDSDERGRFEAEGILSGPLSLVLRFPGGPVIKTQWVVL
jgi:hypothetical protein